MTKIYRVFLVFSSFLMIFPLSSRLDESSNYIEHPKTVLDEVLENPSLSILAKLLFSKNIANTDLIEILESQGPLTLFAPTNQAFEELPSGTVDDWLKPNNKEKLVDLLRYHIVLGKYSLEDIKRNRGLMTLDGQHIRIKVHNNKVLINNADVLKPNIEYQNGIVQVIDQVLIPK